MVYVHMCNLIRHLEPNSQSTHSTLSQDAMHDDDDVVVLGCTPECHVSEHIHVSKPFLHIVYTCNM